MLGFVLLGAFLFGFLFEEVWVVVAGWLGWGFAFGLGFCFVFLGLLLWRVIIWVEVVLLLGFFPSISPAASSQIFQLQVRRPGLAFPIACKQHAVGHPSYPESPGATPRPANN